mmetsp:Transcript_2852/g.4313  ORF Transcript_2852/g.4313 Transcript_2852/m.4313 type:complete len:202 (-) Transcript_2852:727-1332(-)
MVFCLGTGVIALTSAGSCFKRAECFALSFLKISSKLATAQKPGSRQRNISSPDLQSTTTHPPSCVNTPFSTASFVGTKAFLFLNDTSTKFCRRNVASSNGRLAHPPTKGIFSKLFTLTSPLSPSNSRALSGHLLFLCPTAIASSIQGCSKNGFPTNPPMTAGNVPHAPSPQDMPNNLTYGDISSSSGLHPLSTPNLRPASP